MMQDFIRISENDNVAVALKDLDKGYSFELGDTTVSLLQSVKRGHKFALSDIKSDNNVIKYGYPIGYAKCDIRVGEHVHVHNLSTQLGDNLSYSYNPPNEFGSITELREDSFMGYLRYDNRVGIRNELWIIPTVGCVNSVAKAIESKCKNLEGDGIDAVVAFNHPYGCSQMGDDQENTREALTGLIKHPNAGGVLVLGLGCENSNIETLKQYLGDYDKERIEFLVCQEEEDEVAAAVVSLTKLAERMRKDIRTVQPVSKLVVGLKCGGSDGLSGITANPVVGRLSDIICAEGGTTILTEVPEMFGAETILMNRAKDETVFNKIVDLIQGFKEYYRKNNQTIYENPSPGNKEGGISTLEDKALGCTQKAGTSKVIDVLDYAEPVSNKGLNLLKAPGNDLVASTALAISGAQLILFTTGRGTPFAAPVPTVKISTNTALAKNKSQWIDFDCGVLLEEGQSIKELGMKLYYYVIDIANGNKTCSENEGYHDLAIFKQGVTL